MKLWIDIETRSPVPIKHGVAKYATQAEVITVQWAVDDEPPHLTETLRSRPPEHLLSAVAEADELWAHGAEFEQQVLNTQGWWPAIDPTKWRCTMALARMHGLPGGLDKLSDIFKLGESAKDKRGRQLIQTFCVPDINGRYNDARSHFTQWVEFCQYALQDIVAMRALYHKLPKWNATPRMWAAWHLDQKMNAQGVAVDLKLAAGAVKATTRAKKRMADRVEDMTLGVVERATQRGRLLSYLADYGVDLPDLTADTVERRLGDENLPEHVKELLRVRQQVSKASTAKYSRVLDYSVAGRLRNLLVFCGAARTGRWAGRTIQPQNFPRGSHKPLEVEQAIVAFQNDAIELLNPDECLALASSCLRGLFVAEEGRKLCVADLANIEGRDMAWIAGEQWKLDAFRAYDEGRGPDLYKVAYARAFNVDPASVDDGTQRQIGKVMELSLQYYGGVGAFCSMAETYGLRLEELAAAAWPVIPQEFKDQTLGQYAKAVRRRRTYGLEERTWLTCHSLVLMWRAAHPAIVSFWSELEAAVRAAVHANKATRVRRVVVARVENWLRVRLPSGRYLSYPAPRASDEGVSFVGVDPYTKQWGRVSTYSGKLAENIVQASSADILMDGLLAADAAGYNPVLSVHDEIICEPPDEDGYNDEHLSKLMTSNSPWAAGLPLAAKGFTAKRYAKK